MPADDLDRRALRQALWLVEAYLDQLEEESREAYLQGRIAASGDMDDLWTTIDCVEETALTIPLGIDHTVDSIHQASIRPRILTPKVRFLYQFITNRSALPVKYEDDYH